MNLAPPTRGELALIGRLRTAMTAVPEFLLRSPGGPRPPAGDLVYADLVTTDDLICATWALGSWRSERILLPRRAHPSLAPAPDDYSALATPLAFYQVDAVARMQLDPLMASQLLPRKRTAALTYDPQTFSASVWLLRYEQAVS